MSNEPIVVLGDSGEYVTLLQERLQLLGYYEGFVDGQYESSTEVAVQRFQEAAGLEQNGQAEESTWAALEQYEAYNTGDDAADSAEDPADERQLSEDGNWWWDGTDWQAVDDASADAADPDADQAHLQVAFQLSPDGQWQWDGGQWLPADGAAGSVGLKTASTADALIGFETGLADLLPEHMAILDELAADLNAHPLNGGYVTLSGGTDRRGDAAKNKALGQQRAEVVRDYLVQRVDDEETRREIRAYSIGAPDDGPEGDQPDLRRVDIVVARRTVELPKPHPTDPLPQGPLPTGELDPKFKLPLPKPGPQEWPSWFWTQLPPRPSQPTFLHELSAWLNQTLGTHDLARIGGRIAGVFHFNEKDVTRLLDEAFQDGGEDGVKTLLEKLFRQFNTPSPQQPGLPDPNPFPDPDGKTPKIKF
jgi:outer membrane protein OmpA-like peptidoglycan-associated protein